MEAIELQRETSKLASMLRDTVVDMLGPSSFQAHGLEGGHSVLGLSEVFFVFSDIEESSSLGSADPTAFE